MKFKIYVLLLLDFSSAQIPTKMDKETGESNEQEEISQLNLPKQELTALYFI